MHTIVILLFISAATFKTHASITCDIPNHNTMCNYIWEHPLSKVNADHKDFTIINGFNVYFYYHKTYTKTDEMASQHGGQFVATLCIGTSIIGIYGTDENMQYMLLSIFDSRADTLTIQKTSIQNITLLQGNSKDLAYIKSLFYIEVTQAITCNLVFYPLQTFANLIVRNPVNADAYSCRDTPTTCFTIYSHTTTYGKFQILYTQLNSSIQAKIYKCSLNQDAIYDITNATYITNALNSNSSVIHIPRLYIQNVNTCARHTLQNYVTFLNTTYEIFTENNTYFIILSISVANNISTPHDFPMIEEQVPIISPPYIYKEYDVPEYNWVAIYGLMFAFVVCAILLCVCCMHTIQTCKKK